MGSALIRLNEDDRGVTEPPGGDKSERKAIEGHAVREPSEPGRLIDRLG